MFISDAQRGDATLAGHTDGCLLVDAQVCTGIDGCEERLKVGSGGERRGIGCHGEKYPNKVARPIYLQK
jgi:hypothetical protein